MLNEMTELAGNKSENLKDLRAFLRLRALPTTGSKAQLQQLVEVYQDVPLVPEPPSNLQSSEHDDPSLQWFQITPMCSQTMIPRTFNFEKIVNYLSTLTVTWGNTEVEEGDDYHVVTKKAVVKGRSIYSSKCISFAELCAHPRSRNILLRANCDPSMPKASERDVVRLPRVTIYPSGDIGQCSCNCKGSSDGRCCHVAALLYLAENLALNQEPIIRWASTSKSQAWGQGSLRMKNPTTLTQKRYTKKLDPSRYLDFNPAPQMMDQDPTEHLLYCIERAHLPTSALQTVVRYNYEDYTLTPERIDVLKILCQQLLDSLSLQIEFVSRDLTLSTESGLHVQGTEGQSESDDWQRYRELRITGSTFKSFVTSPFSLATSLWEKRDISHLVSVKWGRDNEGIARKLYQDIHGVKVHQCGFFISNIDPLFGSSPDGIIIEDDGLISLEIKCPFSLRQIDFNELTDLSLAKKRTLPFTIKSDNFLSLKKSHKYYYQIQLNIFVTGAKYAHLFW